jgi:ABC-type Fe3+ transport system substrate-binding protein
MNPFFLFRQCSLPSWLLLGLLSFLAVRAEDNEVIVISPDWDGIKDETSRAFSAWHEKKYGHTAVIRWHEAGGGTSQIIRFLRGEFKSSPSADIDVLYGGGVEPFLELQKSGLLTPYDPPADSLAQIPALLNGNAIIDPGHEWFGTSLSGFGIITNEQVRRATNLPEVHTWSDLADPRLDGWISACDPRASGSAMQIYEIVLQSYGWDKGWAVLMALSGNTRNFLSSSAASAVEVGMGDAAFGVAIDSYGEAQAAYYGPDNISFVLPEGQTLISPDSVAILKNPPHPEMARRFVDFLLSREGQLLWMLPKGSPGGAVHNIINRMSVWPALYGELGTTTPVRTNPFQLHSNFAYSAATGSRRRTILSVLIADSMIDTHDLLVPAWKALNSPAFQRLPPEKQKTLRADFLAPPCSEQELLHLADTDWNNPVARTALVNRWQSEALDRYKRVLAQIGSN